MLRGHEASLSYTKCLALCKYHENWYYEKHFVIYVTEECKPEVCQLKVDMPIPRISSLSTLTRSQLETLYWFFSTRNDRLKNIFSQLTKTSSTGYKSHRHHHHQSERNALENPLLLKFLYLRQCGLLWYMSCGSDRASLWKKKVSQGMKMRKSWSPAKQVYPIWNKHGWPTQVGRA